MICTANLLLALGISLLNLAVGWADDLIVPPLLYTHVNEADPPIWLASYLCNGPRDFPEGEPVEEDDYPRIKSLDNNDPNSFCYTYRANLLGIDVAKEWDPMKLINTDRPDFTDVATVVGKDKVQFENGWSYDRRRDENTTILRHTLPETLLRVGMSDTLELRAKWVGYANVTTRDAASGLSNQLSGVTDLQLGFKWVAVPQRNWRPLHSFVGRLVVPFGDPATSANTVQPGLTWLYHWQVRKWLFVRCASGFDFFRKANAVVDNSGAVPVFVVRRDSFLEAHQSISAYWQLAPRFGLFTEYFLLYRTGAADNRPDSYHDYGLYIYATPDFQFDVRIGQRIGGRVDEVFTGAGVSWRW